jgi:hypothetical protein
MTERRWWIVACLVVAAAGYGAGRFTTPTRVEWQKTIEFREVAAKRTEAGPTKKTARVVSETLPGGGRRTTTDYVLERGPVLTIENRTTEGKTVETETKTWEAPRLTLGLKGGLAIDQLQPTWGAFGHYRVLGPFNLGVDYTRKDNIVQGTVSATF